MTEGQIKELEQLKFELNMYEIIEKLTDTKFYDLIFDVASKNICDYFIDTYDEDWVVVECLDKIKNKLRWDLIDIINEHKEKIKHLHEVKNGND